MKSISILVFFATSLFAAHVNVTSDNLWVDGQKAPFLFGAEVQYFRARGGSGRNVPASTVEALWNKMLDRVNEAGMNSVSFYIPWDFHEPVEGVFDFDGTLDLDHDGQPDYPSRNIKKFLELVEKHGIRYVMVRPGPYINAEWGPEGFGAVPKWFLDNYPQALTQNKHTGKPRVASFSHPDFRMHVERWFKALYDHVLKKNIGPGKPIVFLQIDNETNYFWDSIYERDWSKRSIARYHEFLRKQYSGDITKLNHSYGTALTDFDHVSAPSDVTDTTYPKRAWQYDWYQFHDEEILDYYKFLRAYWEKLGIHQPDVLFTSCDSFNSPDSGLLPRLDYRDSNALTLSTLNIYPKTTGSAALSTLNHPMKAAHDANLFASAHRLYYGSAGDWLLATETMGGWFPPTEVTLASRAHTYGSLLASGLKGMLIYYFHEGWNWSGKESSDTELHFDAPLDRDMNPRPAFSLLKGFGRMLKSEGDKFASAVSAPSSILIAHDSAAQYSVSPALNVQELESTDSASLFGLLREAGYSSIVSYVDALSDGEISKFKVILWNHPGYMTEKTRARLQTFLTHGGAVITIGHTRLKAEKGKLIEWKENPARGWDSDEYLKLKNPALSISLVKNTLRSLNVLPETTIISSDGLPYLHASVRGAAGGMFLTVENFLPKKREFEIKIPSLPSHSIAGRLIWDGGLEEATGHFRMNGAQSLHLNIGADSVATWWIE